MLSWWFTDFMFAYVAAVMGLAWAWMQLEYAAMRPHNLMQMACAVRLGWMCVEYVVVLARRVVQRLRFS